MYQPLFRRVAILFAVALCASGGGNASGRAAPPPEEQMQARAHFNSLIGKGIDLYQKHSMPEALPLLQEAVMIAETKLYDGVNHPDILGLHFLIGDIQILAQDFQGAARSLKLACEGWRRFLRSGGSIESAGRPFVRSLVALAQACRMSGALGEASDWGEEAQKIIDKAHLQGSLFEAEFLVELASIRASQGELSEAELLLSRALAIRVKLRESVSLINQVRRARSNLCLMRHQRGDAGALRKAEQDLNDIEHTQSAHVLREPKTLADREVVYDFASTLQTKAVLQCLQKKYAEGQATLLKAVGILRMIEPRVPAARVTLANCLYSLGGVSRLLRQDQDAKKYLEESIKLQENGERNPLSLAHARLELGGLLLISGKEREAFDTLQTGLELVEAWLDSVLPGLAGRQRLLLLSEQRVILDVWIGAALATRVPDEQIYARILAWKGRVITMPIANVIAHNNPALRPLVRSYQQACQQFANRVIAGVAQEGGQQEGAPVLGMMQVVRRIEDELKRESRTSFSFPAILPMDVASSLPERVAVIEFFQYAAYRKGGEGEESVVAESRMLAFVIRKGSIPVSIQLHSDGHDIRKIGEQVRKWRHQLNVYEDPSYPPQLNAIGKMIAEMAWKPLAKHLGNLRLVIVCPDGPRAFFPFAALPGERPRTYLGDDLYISYAVSGLQVQQMFASRPSAKLGRNALIVAGVDYSGQKPPIDDLTHTLSLGEDVKEAYKRLYPAEDGLLLSGAKATKQRFLDELPRNYRMISLMLHGKVYQGFSPLALNNFRATSLPHDPLNAMLDIKLLFAGENPQASLSGFEFATHAIEGIQLLALWSCSLAGGAETRAGVINFIQMAHLAGARSVIASLWNEQTVHGIFVARRFFKHIGGGSPSLALAMNQAQRDQRAFGGENAHPRSWAGWLFSGDIGSLAPSPDQTSTEKKETQTSAVAVFIASLFLVALLAFFVCLWWWNQSRRSGTHQ